MPRHRPTRSTIPRDRPTRARRPTTSFRMQRHRPMRAPVPTRSRHRPATPPRLPLPTTLRRRLFQCSTIPRDRPTTVDSTRSKIPRDRPATVTSISKMPRHRTSPPPNPRAPKIQRHRPHRRRPPTSRRTPWPPPAGAMPRQPAFPPPGPTPWWRWPRPCSLTAPPPATAASATRWWSPSPLGRRAAGPRPQHRRPAVPGGPHRRLIWRPVAPRWARPSRGNQRLIARRPRLPAPPGTAENATPAAPATAPVHGAGSRRRLPAIR